MAFESHDTEWDQPKATGFAHPPTKAAWFVWIIGLLQVVLLGCCSTAYLTLSLLPEDQLKEAIEQQTSDPAITEAFNQDMFRMVAGLCFFLGFVPGVLYLILGFGVQKSKPNWTSFTILLLITQAIVLGVLTLAGIAQGLFTGNPSMVTLNLLLMGTPLLILGYTIYFVRKAANYNRDTLGTSSDPWNET